jgi:hypothetical protein
MNGKKWVKIWFFIVITIIPFIVILNFFIDPLWFFKHSHRLNTLQIDFDERLQKTIKLKYNQDLKDINTLLMGSSRTTYYDQNKFGNLRVFNFAFSSAYPAEYKYYINYAKLLKGDEFANIILGLDFYGCGKSREKNEKPDYLSDLKRDQLYILSHYTSLDATQYSLTNIFRSLANRAGGRSYNRNNVVITDKQNAKKVEKRAASRSKTYWKNLEYDENYSKILKELKTQNPKSIFIIYTTPLSKPFLQVLYGNKKLKEYYFRWIKDMVAVFDKVYFFTLPSTLSENYAIYSKDGDHYYPDAVENISIIISGQKDIKGYGIIITKDNVDRVLIDLEKQIGNYDLNQTVE